MALSAEARRKLVRFRDLGNPGDLHPYDQERWRAFVIQAHNDGGEIAENDVSEVLKEKWVEEVATRLGGRYYEERMLLHAYDQSREP